MELREQDSHVQAADVKANNMIGKIVGNYKIISEIGHGGMGIVYLAEHISLGKKFAVKCLLPELTSEARFRNLFYQEARNQALLEYHRIVQATDFFEQEGLFFLVMEYVSGESLDKIITRRGKIPEKEALRIFKEVLDALSFAHWKGLIHRDIKPSNILIDKNGKVRITDFGIAIIIWEKRLTAPNIGSWLYISPEQIKRPKEPDIRSDIYSAGIVLYEMLTGHVPFDGDTPFEIQSKHIHSPVPDPVQKNPQISKPISQIILKALSKNPDNRFKGCREFLISIENYERDDIRNRDNSSIDKIVAFIGQILLIIIVVCYFSYNYIYL